MSAVAARCGGTRSWLTRRSPGRAPRRPPAAAPRRAAARAAVIDVDEASWESEVVQASAETPVLVDFWATWCGPCKLVAPLLAKVQAEVGEDKLKICKVDCDANPALVEKYSVYGLPTLMVFKDGAKVNDSHNEGAITTAGILDIVKEHAL